MRFGHLYGVMATQRGYFNSATAVVCLSVFCVFSSLWYVIEKFPGHTYLLSDTRRTPADKHSFTVYIYVIVTGA